MPFIPHTPEDIHQMLDAIGISSIQNLFDEIPESLRVSASHALPPGLSEMEIRHFMNSRANEDAYRLCFLGAGAYEHYIPSIVWEIANRGEWTTPYTPYQAEASQGTLQLLYEYQTMASQLLAMEISNASLYDGASALAEAILMAVRCQAKEKGKRLVKPSASSNKNPLILMPSTVHPHYRQVVKTLVEPQSIDIEELPFCPMRGTLQPETLKNYEDRVITALVIPMPNFWGAIEAFDILTDWAHQSGALVIALVNPLSMGLLKPPGLWGKQGADIACGEGQPLGIPMTSGGPYFGLMCCKRKYIRQLPGRLVGRTTDPQGRMGFTLTLQAREQHIRRAKATSNICTNQGLLVAVATLYMSIMGSRGLKAVATQCHDNAHYLASRLTKIPGVKRLFETTPFFHEFVLQLPVETSLLMQKLSSLGILAGLNLQLYYPELRHCLLINVTETKSKEAMDDFIRNMALILEKDVLHVDI